MLRHHSKLFLLERLSLAVWLELNCSLFSRGDIDNLVFYLDLLLATRRRIQTLFST